MSDGSACLPPVILVPGVCGSTLSAQNTVTKKHDRAWINTTILPYPQTSEKFMTYLAGHSVSPTATGAMAQPPIHAPLPGTINQSETAFHPLIYETPLYASHSEQRGYCTVAAIPSFDGCERMISSRVISLLGSRGKKTVGYFETIATHLCSHYGYKRNVNLFAFTYDWRQSLSDPSIQEALLREIQRARDKSGGRKVCILAHSMGCVLITVFMRMYPRWRDNICGFIALGAPFRGSGTCGLSALAHGYNIRKPIHPCVPRSVQSGAGSTPYLIYAGVEQSDYNSAVDSSVLVRCAESRAHSDNESVKARANLSKQYASVSRPAELTVCSSFHELPEECPYLQLNRSIYSSDEVPPFAALVLMFIEERHDALNREMLYAISVLGGCCKPGFIVSPALFSHANAYRISHTHDNETITSNLVCKLARSSFTEQPLLRSVTELALQALYHPLSISSSVRIIPTIEPQPADVHASMQIKFEAKDSPLTAAFSCPEHQDELLLNASPHSLVSTPSYTSDLSALGRSISILRASSIIKHRNEPKALAPQVAVSSENFVLGNTHDVDLIISFLRGTLFCQPPTSHDASPCFSSVQQTTASNGVSSRRINSESLLSRVSYFKTNHSELSPSMSSKIFPAGIAVASSCNYILSHKRCPGLRYAVDMLTLMDESSHLEHILTAKESNRDAFNEVCCLYSIEQPDCSTDQSDASLPLTLNAYDPIKKPQDVDLTANRAESNLLYSDFGISLMDPPPINNHPPRRLSNLLRASFARLRLRERNRHLMRIFASDKTALPLLYAREIYRLAKSQNKSFVHMTTQYALLLRKEYHHLTTDDAFSCSETRTKTLTSVALSLQEIYLASKRPLRHSSSDRGSVWQRPLLRMFSKKDKHTNISSGAIAEPSRPSEPAIHALEYSKHLHSMQRSTLSHMDKWISSTIPVAEYASKLTIPGSLDSILYPNSEAVWTHAAQVLQTPIDFENVAPSEFQFMGICGSGYVTPVHLLYNESVSMLPDIPYRQPVHISSQGDGTVPLFSALADPFTEPYVYDRVVLHDCGHFPMLHDERILALVAGFLHHIS